MQSSLAGFYVTGGTLSKSASSYVVRQADTDLYNSLLAGEFCYVLNSRQMGKSSLMVRTAERLKLAGVKVAVLDLTAIGQNLSPEQWYDGLLLRLGRQLDLEDEVEDFYTENARLSPLQRWQEALTRIVLPHVQPSVTIREADEAEGGRSSVPGADALRSAGNATVASPALRSGAAGTEVRLPAPTGVNRTPSLVVFVDEIDVVRSLPFSADEFFAAIRQCYVGRATDPALYGICFCLLGTATPADLISDTRTSPFNIGKRVEVTDFTPEEAAPLAAGLVQGIDGREERILETFQEGVSENDKNLVKENGVNAAFENLRAKIQNSEARQLLNRILYWTGGHPYLTQKLCRVVAAEIGHRKSRAGNRDVDRLCAELFLTHTARESDDNLMFIRNRLLRSEVDLPALLDLYGQMRRGKRVAYDETNPLCPVLRLSGVAALRGGLLKVRNRIYEHVFDREWVKRHLPDAERRRQRSAFWSGILRATAVYGVILGVMAWLTSYALHERQIARDTVSLYRDAARDAEARKKDAIQSAGDAQQSAKIARQEKSKALASEQAAKGESTAAKRAQAKEILAVQKAREAERKAYENAQQARHYTQLATVKSVESRRLLTELNESSGERLMSEGNMLDALLPFAQAQMVESGHENAWQKRLRFAIAQRESPRLAQMWFPPIPSSSAKTVAGDVHASTPITGFLAGGKQMLVAYSGKPGEVWNADTGHTGPLTLSPGALDSPLFTTDDGVFLLTERADKTWRLWNTRTGKSVYPPFRQPDVVRSSPDLTFALSADGSIALMYPSSPDGSHNYWLLDMTTGKTKSVAFSSERALVFLGLSRDGGKLVTWEKGTPGDPAAREGAFQVWDARTGLPVGLPLSGQYQARAVFRPGGSQLVVAGYPLRLWEPDTGRTTPLVWDYVNDIDLTPSGDRCVIASGKGYAQVVDATTGRAVTPPLKQEGYISQCAFSPDGRRVVTAAATGTARAWDSVTGESETPTLRMADISLSRFSPDGRYLMLQSQRGDVRVWDLAAAGMNRFVSMHSQPDRPQRSPDGRRIAGIATDLTARVWDIATTRTLVRLPVSPVDIRFSLDGKRLVTADERGTVQIWNAASGSAVGPALRFAGKVESVAFCLNGQDIITVSQDGFLRLWEANTLRPVGKPFRNPGRNASFVLSPDGRWLVPSAGDGKTTQLWNLVTGRIAKLGDRSTKGRWSVSFSPDSRHLAITDYEQGLKVYDLASGNEIQSVAVAGETNAPLVLAVYSPDGTRLATADQIGTVLLRDVARLQPVTAPLQHAHEIHDMAFSPDGRLLVTGDEDTTMQLWDATNGAHIVTLKNHAVSRITVGADGRHLATSGARGMEFWELPVDQHAPADALLLARLFTAQEFQPNMGLMPFPVREQQAAWNKLRAAYPADFISTIGLSLEWHRREADALEKDRRWPEALAHLNAMATAQPGEADILLQRASVHAALADWKQAEADAQSCLALNRESTPAWRLLALMCLASGDQAGYRQTCLQMLSHFWATPNVTALTAATVTCSLGPNGLDNYAPAIALAEHSPGRPRPQGRSNVLGALLYRAGRYDDAIRQLEDIRQPGSDRPGDRGPGGNRESTGRNAFILALAYRHQGRIAEAQHALATGNSELDRLKNGRQEADFAQRGAFSILWQNVFELEMLRKEAEKALSQK